MTQWHDYQTMYQAMRGAGEVQRDVGAQEFYGDRPRAAAWAA